MPFQYSPTQQRGRKYQLDHGGSVPAATMAITSNKVGDDGYTTTLITLTDAALAITDANAYGSVKIFDFPEGIIDILGCAMTVAPTTTSTIATTLNSAAVLNVGIGTAAASNITLASTMLNIVGATAAASSATINVAAATVTGVGGHTIVNGSSTAADAYLNCAVPTNTEIDADATTTWSGTVLLRWKNLSDAPVA